MALGLEGEESGGSDAGWWAAGFVLGLMLLGSETGSVGFCFFNLFLQASIWPHGIGVRPIACLRKSISTVCQNAGYYTFVYDFLFACISYRLLH